MFSSEKKSLFRFLLIYFTSTFLLFSLASWIFYISAKRHLVNQQREGIRYESQRILGQIRTLHQSDAATLVYPHNSQVQSAIYDLDQNYIFGTFHTSKMPEESPDGMLQEVLNVNPYYLGAAHLVLRKKIDFTPIDRLERDILLFMFGAGIFFAILGYFLGKLFVAPMRQAIEKMNHFIQDATHELNTPISTILTNIEMIETFGECKEHHKELQRIEIASKTLSRIYDDLAYLNLNHQYHRNVVDVDMTALLDERLLYFAGMIEAKELIVEVEAEKNIFKRMDRNDAIRLMDNLISNAIKYNVKGGKLIIYLTQNQFRVGDTGIGISQDDLGVILGRFKRANKSEGGFGIGLDIVDQVIRTYGFTLMIKSQETKGTEVTLQW